MTTVRRTVLVVAAAALLGHGAAAQQSLAAKFRWAEVATCPAADTLLGPLKGDWAARVHGIYDADGDSTILWSGETRYYDEPWSVRAAVSFAGAVPRDYPRAVFGVFLHDKRLREAVTAPSPPVAALELDDSITVALGVPVVGAYVGGPELQTVPLSVNLSELQFAGLVRARKIVVRLDKRALTLSGDDRRNLRGLYRLAACRAAVRFGDLAFN